MQSYTFKDELNINKDNDVIVDSRRQYNFSNWVHETEKQLLKYGMNINKCDCYEFIIVYVVKNAKERGDIVSSFFVSILPELIIKLIFDYLNIDLYQENKSENELKESKLKQDSLFGLNGKAVFEQKVLDNHAVTFTLPLNTKQGKMIENYFNNMIPHSAQMEEMREVFPRDKDKINYEEFKRLWQLLSPGKQVPPIEEIKRERNLTKPQVMVHVDVEALSYPGLLLDIEDAFKQLPHRIRDDFRQKSKTIGLNTAKCLCYLEKAKKNIEKNKFDKKLLTKIDMLIQHIDKNGLEQKEHTARCESLINEIHSLNKNLLEKSKVTLLEETKIIEESKSPFSKFFETPKKKETIFSTTFNVITEIDSDISAGLNGIRIIVDKSFSLNLSQIEDNESAVFLRR